MTGEGLKPLRAEWLQLPEMQKTGSCVVQKPVFC